MFNDNMLKMRLLLALTIWHVAPVVGVTTSSKSLFSISPRQASTWSVDENRLSWPETTASTVWPDWTSTTQSWLVVSLPQTHTSTEVLLNTINRQALPAASTEVSTITLTALVTIPRVCLVSNMTTTVTVTVAPAPVEIKTVTEYLSRSTVITTVTVAVITSLPTTRTMKQDVTATSTSTVTVTPVVIVSTVTPFRTVTLPTSTPEPSTVTLPPSPPSVSTVTLPRSPPATSFVTLWPAPPAITVTKETPGVMTTLEPADPYTYDRYTPWVPHIVGHSFDGPRSKDFNTAGVEPPLYPTYTAVNPVDPPGRSYVDMYETLKKKRDVAYVPSLVVDENLSIWRIGSVTAADTTLAVFESVPTQTPAVVVTSTFNTTVIVTPSVAPVTSVEAFTTTSYTILGLDTSPATRGLGKRVPKHYSDTKWTTSVDHHRIPGGAFPTAYPGTIRAAQAEHPDDGSATASYTAAVGSHTVEAPILLRDLNASGATVVAESTNILDQIMTYPLIRSENGTVLTTHTLKIPITHLGYTPSTRPRSPHPSESSTRVPNTFKTLVTRD